MRKTSVDDADADATNTAATEAAVSLRSAASGTVHGTSTTTTVMVTSKRGSHSSDTSSVFSDTMISSPSLQTNEGIATTVIGDQIGGESAANVPFIDSDDEMDAVRTAVSGGVGQSVDEETAHDADVDDDGHDDDEDDEDEEEYEDRDELHDNQHFAVDDDVLEENEEEDDEEDLVESMDVSITESFQKL